MSEDKYKPTKVEWVAVSMQAWIPMLLSQMRRLHPTEEADDVRVFFKAMDRNTLGVAVRHVKTVPKPVVEYLEQEINREVSEIVQHHGWENGMKIEWDVR
ncbi:MAG: hypothetical protein AB1646_13550 [Thermodesulfobacteriota bacterium]